MSYTYQLATSDLWTPANLTGGMSAWFDAADTASIVSSGGSVSQWKDKSGNGHHAVQGTVASQPTTGVDTLNGLNVLTTNGNDSMKADYSIFNSRVTMNATVIIVFKTDINDTSFEGVFGGCNGAAFSYVEIGVSGGNRAPRVNSRSTPSLDSLSYVTANFYTSAGIVVAQTTPTTLDVWANGDLQSTLSTSTMTATVNVGGINIGHRDAGSTGGLIGQLAEVIVLQDIVLSATDRQLIEGYLRKKWGTTLISGHPYETNSPY